MEARVIKDSNIHQGDLVYIRHTEKPYKSGWWRLVRLPYEAAQICYVLEVPTHKNFTARKNDGSRVIDGCYVMSRKNVKSCSIEGMSGPVKYEILACLKGVSSIKASKELTNNQRSLVRTEDYPKDCIIFTPGYKQMVDHYYGKSKKNVYLSLAEELS